VSGGCLGRLFAWAAIGLVCLVLVPFVLFSALLGASSAASCGTAAVAPGDFASLGDLSGDDPSEMPPLAIARRIYAAAVAMRMADERRVLTAYAVALVESGGGVTMVNVRGSPGDPGSTSTGVFQQRDISPWNRRNRNNVAAAAVSFFEALRGADHGQSIGELAADIQRPLESLRYKYALVVDRARWFLERVKRSPGAASEGLGSITAAGTGCGGPVGPPGKGKIDPKSNDLVPPANAPPRVVGVIEAANRINDTPYVWGGGHGAWEDSGYDCSGSVSYALHGGGLLDSPLVSGAFSSWGKPGPGRWITVYSSSVHVFMYVAGVRFDTSSYEPVSSGDGPRWRTTDRPKAGFVVTHPGGY
jgi:hypothetical protein